MSMETFMAALRPLPATSPMMTSRPPSLGGLDVEEVAADLVGGVVDGVDFEAGGFELFVGNHQLLHAAGGGQFAGGALLVALDAQEADEDDETMARMPVKSAMEAKWMGMGPAWK
jgi:hypothetical protein